MSARAAVAPVGAAAVLLVAWLSGCEANRAPVESAIEPVSQRTYRVTKRRDHDPKRPAPVLFALHAYATAPDVLPEAYSLARKAAGDRGYLVVVPEGERDDSGNPFWNASKACCGNTTRTPDDVRYLSGVLDDLAKRYALDTQRIFVIGVSNGAFMAQRWACAEPRVRALVAISGVGVGPDDPPCARDTPIRLLQIHGDADDVILFGGGTGVRGRYPSVKSSVEDWRKRAGCSAKPHEETTWSPLHGSTSRTDYTGPQSAVSMWIFEGGGHNLRSLRFAVDEMLSFMDP